MIYVIVDSNGSTHSRFDNYADLLAELDETLAGEPGLIDDLAVLKYTDAGLRSGPPVPAVNLIPRETRKVGAPANSNDSVKLPAFEADRAQGYAEMRDTFSQPSFVPKPLPDRSPDARERIMASRAEMIERGVELPDLRSKH